ncbi:PIR Superfamily Protein [Plasmodium ovale curtisi]|uniref:PIR Superfamily Protein n=1 Tax=Plasmodium ovale curtisi TaxID=864141 RepID=A0A1A8WC47_PLAOA|nr:PIR Superfamily Protein [Plasmodium ovale curtisi]
MTETIYSFVSLYNTFNSKIDGYNEEDSSDTSHYCNHYSHNFNNVKSTCYKVLMFLNHLEANNKPYYIAKGCRFLNYWLYKDDIHKKKNTFNAEQFYESLKRHHNSYFHGDLCGNNIEHISEDIIANIQKLIKLHEDFNNNVLTKKSLDHDCEEPLEYAGLYDTYMNDFCVDINNVFCVELENFKPKYDTYMINKKCAENVPKTLKSIQRVNIAAAVVLPFVIILVVPFITLILYKFTSFGPWLLPLIRKYNRILNNFNDENNHMVLSDSESHEPYINKRAYNIEYRSTINS